MACRIINDCAHDTERYRSGRNGGASKASCRVTGTWVRIPPSPPNSILSSFSSRKLARLSHVGSRIGHVGGAGNPLLTWRFEPDRKRQRRPVLLMILDGS